LIQKLKDGEWIRTYTNKQFMPLKPHIEDICIEDIAHALSMVCRYGGHCSSFFSVAQHSCMVSDHMPEFKLEGLLHDGTEAYLGDIVRPVKHSPTMRLYRRAEDHLDVMLHEKFDLDPAARRLVKQFDNAALVTEMIRLFEGRREESKTWSKVNPLPVKRIVCWSPARSEKEFLKRWEKLKR
jgi:hypothetical protein